METVVLEDTDGLLGDKEFIRCHGHTVERQQHGGVSGEEAAPTDGGGVHCFSHPLRMSFGRRSLQSGGWEWVERRVYALV